MNFLKGIRVKNMTMEIVEMDLMQKKKKYKVEERFSKRQRTKNGDGDEIQHTFENRDSRFKIQNASCEV